MIRQATIDKLHDMRLSAMADAFENQCNDTKSYEHLSFEDRFGMLVDKEWDKRQSTKLRKSFVMRDSAIRMPALKILNITQTEIWINPRCWNSQPVGI